MSPRSGLRSAHCLAEARGTGVGLRAHRNLPGKAPSLGPWAAAALLPPPPAAPRWLRWPCPSSCSLGRTAKGPGRLCLHTPAGTRPGSFPISLETAHLCYILSPWTRTWGLASWGASRQPRWSWSKDGDGCGRNLGRSLGSPWRVLHPHPGCSRRQASGSVNKPITHLPAGPGTELEGPPGSASHPPAPPGTERGLGSTQSGEGLAVRTPQARPGPLTCASRGAPPPPWPSRGQKQTPLWGAMASENPVGWPQTSRG